MSRAERLCLLFIVTVILTGMALVAAMPLYVDKLHSPPPRCCDNTCYDEHGGPS